MKRVILPIAFFGLLTGLNAQSSMREIVRGDNGISKHYVTLKASQQVNFSEALANSIFNFDADLKVNLKKAESDDLGNINYRFYQSYKGIPVEGAMYIVQTKNGKATGISGEVITDVPASLKNASTTDAIAKQTAIDAAIKFVGAKEYAWQNTGMEQDLKNQTSDKSATYAPSAKLVWFNKSTDDDQSFNPSNLVLAYKIDVYARVPLSRAYYFVDATSGKVLGKHDIINESDAPGTANTYWSGKQNIHSDVNSGTYRLRDYTKGSGIITLHGESGKRGQDYTSSSATWNLTGQDQAAMDAHFGVSSTYAFYFKVFHRNSYDNNGTALTSYVNDPTYIDNAFWDGSSMNFNKRSTGENGGVTGIDVTGHELTHGVTQTTSELVYSKEPGAMNESMSDIMGKNVQFYTKHNDINWQLSNDMNWIIRDMSNPKLVQQPNTYKGQYWKNGGLDNGGVHTNSGIGNYMYYLLVEGGSGTNDNGDSYTVKGIGAKAAFIIYRTETVYLFPNAVYSDWRTACINAATDLYGASSQAVKSVQDAFYAIGIGSASAIVAGTGTSMPELKIAPNPVSGFAATVNYQLVKNGNTVLKVTDLNSGRVSQTITLGNLASGKYTYNLTSAASLPVGNYVLSIEQNAVLVSRTKFLVTK
ncbi:MAG: M4 family metallopeptidase [Parafilimonas sp.]